MNPPRPVGSGEVRELSAVPAALSIRGLTVVYQGTPALWDVDYDVPGRTLSAVIGPNGAGKTTLLRSVLGLVPRLAGTVRVHGRDARRSRGDIAYVPQHNSVDWDFPASALDVVAMGLYRRIGWCRPVRRRHREAARAHLDRMGMADFAGRQIGQLSGGQRQRVFLARALAQDARLYLMDEPFAGIDAATERVIVEVMNELREAGAAVVCVHHDLQTVGEYFGHALVLNVRPVAVGDVDEALTESVLQAAYGGRLAAPEIRAAIGGI